MRSCWIRDLLDWAVVLSCGVIAGLAIWWMWLR